MNLRLTAARVPAPAVVPDEHRFRELLGAEQWDCLPAPIRKRFSRKLGDAETATYVGEVAETRLTWTGRVFAQLARLFGSPLPLEPGVRTAAAVGDRGRTDPRSAVDAHLRATGGFPQVGRSAAFRRPDGARGMRAVRCRDVAACVEQRALCSEAAAVRASGRGCCRAG
jgi:hypothetical protein